MPKETYGRAGLGVRRMQTPHVVGGLMLCVLMLGLGWWLYASGKAFAMGPIAGGIVFGVLAAAMNVVDHLDRRAGQMERGWMAEDAVEKALEALGDDCYVIHDVMIRDRGNIDHIVVAPAGVFTIETKSHQGKVTFDGQRLLLNGRGFEKDFLAQAYAQSMVLKEYLTKVSGGDDYFVKPLVVFTRCFVQVKGLAKGVKVLPLKWLTGELTRGKERLSAEQRSRITASLKHMTAEAKGKASA